MFFFHTRHILNVHVKIHFQTHYTKVPLLPTIHTCCASITTSYPRRHPSLILSTNHAHQFE